MAMSLLILAILVLVLIAVVAGIVVAVIFAVNSSKNKSTKIIYCPECGMQLNSENNFCTKCGKSM